MRSSRLRRRLAFSDFVMMGLLAALLAATIISGDNPARGVFAFIAMIVMLIGIFMFASRGRPVATL